MIQLFRLLFSKGYWRNLVSGVFWRKTARAIRRVHKDRRARKELRSSLVLLIAPAIGLFYLLFLLASLAGAAAGSGATAFPLIGFVVAIVVGGTITLARWNESRGKVVPTDPAKRPPPPPASPEFRREIADLALLHAIFADRAGSEDFLRTEVLPEGIEIITRRVQLDLLRERGLYERLDPTVRDLLLRADGHWTPTDCRSGTLALEPLRVLRWCLRADHYLPSVGETLRLSFQLASTTVKEPGALYDRTDFIPYDILNAAFRDAANFMHRCYAEAIHRKLMEPSDEGDQTEAQRIVSTFGEDEHKDLLLDGVIVSNASDFDVLHARLLAARRYHLLSWIAHRLYGDIPAPETLRIFYLDPAPAEAEELK